MHILTDRKTSARFFTVTAGLFLFAFSVPVFAQNAESSGRSVRFVVSDLPPELGKSIHFLGSKGPVECPVSFHRLSPVQNIAVDQTELRLYLKAPVVSEETDRYPAPDQLIQLPDSRKILVILLPGKQPADGKFKLRALAIDESKFPPGSAYFVNTTSISIAAKIGSDTIQIDAESNRLYEPATLDTLEATGVQILLMEQKKWKLFASTRWSFSSNERHLVFFKINPRTGKPDYDSLTEYLEAGDKKP